MKPIYTKLSLWLFHFFFITPVVAQPGFVFKDPTLVSGTHLLVGAKYLFRDVKPGGSSDAIVTISFISPGASLEEIDYFGGYDEALETKINVEPLTNGYVELDIQFIERLPLPPAPIDLTSIVLKVHPVVNATALDIDGLKEVDSETDEEFTLYEYDEINSNVDKPGQTVDYLSTGEDIAITYSGDWIKGQSKKAEAKDGIDITAYTAMFTVRNHGISSLKYRVGVINNTGSNYVRLKSLYFKDLLSVILPISVQLKGKAAASQVKLEWILTDLSDIEKTVLEKGKPGEKFISIKTFSPSTTVYNYEEALPEAQTSLYRLKVELKNGKNIFSNIVRFDNKGNSPSKEMMIFPNPIRSRNTMSILSEKNQSAEILIYTMEGKLIKRIQGIKLEKGQNQLALSIPSDLSAGTYTIVVRGSEELWRTRITKL